MKTTRKSRAPREARPKRKRSRAAGHHEGIDRRADAGEPLRQHRRGRGSHLQLGRCLGAGQAVQREQCIQQVPDGHRACKDVFHAPKRSFRAGGLARENKNVYTQYKEKETGEPDGAEIIGLKPKRRFSACQKIRQPKRKDLGIY